MVVVSGAAKAQIEEISVWWAENRQKAPTLFDDEFSAALERLAVGADDLTTLALELGFSSHSHFTDAFRREFGRPPSAARKTSAL